jgi:hypothetical protein
MAGLAGEVFPVSDRVPGIEGEGIDVLAWYRALAEACPEPTHLVATAGDRFEATVPREQLKDALFQVSKEGYLRLYVPNGTSACLNVKNVVSLLFACDEKKGTEASFGFKNNISPDELSRGLFRR